MWFLGLGVLLLLLKVADIGPVATWGWVWVLLPFGLAALWWAISDATGVSQRRADRKMAERKQARRERDMQALGLDVQREKRVRVMRDNAARRPGGGGPATKAPPAEPPRRDPRP